MASVYYQIVLRNGKEIRVDVLDEPVYRCFVTGHGSRPRLLTKSEMDQEGGMRLPEDPIFNLRHENGTYFEDIADMVKGYSTNGNSIQKIERFEENGK